MALKLILAGMYADDEPPRPRRRAPGVPRELEAICLKCLEKNPARRYASARALAEDLRRFLDDEPVLARPLSLGRRLQLWARRKPILAAHLSAVLLPLLLIHAEHWVGVGPDKIYITLFVLVIPSAAPIRPKPDMILTATVATLLSFTPSRRSSATHPSPSTPRNTGFYFLGYTLNRIAMFASMLVAFIVTPWASVRWLRSPPGLGVAVGEGGTGTTSRGWYRARPSGGPAAVAHPLGGAPPGSRSRRSRPARRCGQPWSLRSTAPRKRGASNWSGPSRVSSRTPRVWSTWTTACCASKASCSSRSIRRCAPARFTSPHAS